LSDDRVVEFERFRLYVARASEAWLKQAEVDFEEDATGGQLTIKAPGIKGSEPPAGAALEERVNWLLETEINPALAAHSGRVKLVEITGKNEVVLQFGGGCHGCGMADVTLKQGIQQTLARRIPEITAVLDATDHRSGKNPYYAAGAKGKSAV
jgi:Fe/S biogenesis protein NfuA